MNIQSLSIVVPNERCVNDCPFCVSKMHTSDYPNLMDDSLPEFDLNMKEYLRRLEFARNNGCNTAMLTGNSEPQQNRKFLTWFGIFMQLMRNPFEWIEMQTTTVLLDTNYLRFLRNHVGVNLISVSVSSLDSERNCDLINAPKNQGFYLPGRCQAIKKSGFSLRLSLNLTKEFEPYGNDPKRLFDELSGLGADQVTMRLLYASETETPQGRWIGKYALSKSAREAIRDYVLQNGKPIGRLPYGQTKYSLDGMCIVMDFDSMSKDAEKMNEETYKYLVLRPDCRLYTQWDDKASLMF